MNTTIPQIADKRMRIGNVEINGHASLAPMAGVGDRAFREICRGFGACMTTTEMASAKGIRYQSKKSAVLMEISDSERPCSIQLFGCEPDTMAFAAEFAMRYSPQFIDINMGCPVPKVNSIGCGCALMTSPSLCENIVRAVTDAVSVPVTVKIRKGIDSEHINAVEVACACEQGGAAAVTVHGRTRQQMYHPFADLSIIRDVKHAVSVPVIGNGDIFCAEDARRMYEYTGCDLVAVGRGALGNPRIFAEINSYFDTDRLMPAAGIYEQLNIMIKHINLLCEYKGEDTGMRESRKHIAWYLKGFRNAAAFRNEAGGLRTIKDFNELVKKVIQAQEI